MARALSIYTVDFSVGYSPRIRFNLRRFVWKGLFYIAPCKNAEDTLKKKNYPTYIFWLYHVSIQWDIKTPVIIGLTDL